MPHSMIVDRTGRRFCNDSYWVDIVEKTLDPEDPHLPFFLVWDEQHHQKYGLGATPPGGEYPAGLVTSAPTLEELADALGIDGEQLAAPRRRSARTRGRARTPTSAAAPSTTCTGSAGDPANEPNPVLGPSRRRRSTGCGCASSAPASAPAGCGSTATGACSTSRAAASRGSTRSAPAPR